MYACMHVCKVCMYVYDVFCKYVYTCVCHAAVCAVGTKFLTWCMHAHCKGKYMYLIIV